MILELSRAGDMKGIKDYFEKIINKIYENDLIS